MKGVETTMENVHDEAWLKLPEGEVGLRDLPEWFSRNGIVITQGVRDRVSARCVEEYCDLYNRMCPEGYLGAQASEARRRMKAEGVDEALWPDRLDPEAWKDAQEEFFRTVRFLETYDFKSGEFPCRTGRGVFRRGLAKGFGTSFPSYNDWRMREALCGLPVVGKEFRAAVEGREPEARVSQKTAYVPKERKNPYVHPSPERHMHNQVGRDGYSFDEPWDKDDYKEEEDQSGPQP